MANSLADLNVGIQNQLFEIFRTTNPREWVRSTQCFYTTTNDKDEAFWRFNTLNKTQQIAYPILTLTKSDPIQRIDMSVYPVLPTGVEGVDPTLRAQYGVLPLQFGLTCRIYTDQFKKCDEYIETIMFIRTIMNSGKYESSVAKGQILKYRADHQGLPKYSIIPQLSGKMDKDGRIYAIDFSMNIFGVILTDPEQVKLIKNVIVNYISKSDIEKNIPDGRKVLLETIKISETDHD